MKERYIVTIEVDGECLLPGDVRALITVREPAMIVGLALEEYGGGGAGESDGASHGETCGGTVADCCGV